MIHISYKTDRLFLPGQGILYLLLHPCAKRFYTLCKGLLMIYVSISTQNLVASVSLCYMAVPLILVGH